MVGSRSANANQLPKACPRSCTAIHTCVELSIRSFPEASRTGQTTFQRKPPTTVHEEFLRGRSVLVRARIFNLSISAWKTSFVQLSHAPGCGQRVQRDAYSRNFFRRPPIGFREPKPNRMATLSTMLPSHRINSQLSQAPTGNLIGGFFEKCSLP